MKKKSQRARSVCAGLLCALFAFTPLCACMGNTPAQTDVQTNAPGESSQTNPEETETKEEEAPMFTVIDNQASSYVLLASTSIEEENAAALGNLDKILTARFGITLSRTQTKGDEPVLEIRKEGETLNWSVSVDNETGDILLCGGCPEAIEKAVNAFLTAFCAGSTQTLAVRAGDYLAYDAISDRIDNSHFLTYITPQNTTLTPSDTHGKLQSPVWIDSLIMVEVRPDMTSLCQNLADADPLLDFYAAAGVNGIWLAPVYRRGNGNGYGNEGPHTVEPALTGKETDEEGWQVVREFVDKAHERGIYVFLDVITWGVNKNSPLTVAHPRWFSGEAWGNAAFNWSVSELREWFTDVCVQNILTTGADGFRCDCEPVYTDYSLFGDVRSRLAEQGKYIMVMSEDGNIRRSTYDMEQDGAINYAAMSRADYYFKPVNTFVDGYSDIVESCLKGTGLGPQAYQRLPTKTGTFRYYTNCLTNHDFVGRIVNGNRLNIGYAAIYAPFIPLWYMGDECNASANKGTLYYERVDFSEAEQPANAYFLEDVKRMIEIRRTYPEIFAYWPINHRDTNLCAVTAEGLEKLSCYARYAENKAILILPNHDPESTGIATVTIPYSEAGIGGYSSYRVTNLLTGRVVATGSAEEIGKLSVIVPCEEMGVYLVEGIAN